VNNVGVYIELKEALVSLFKKRFL